jgi:L-lactate dehydrogenase (cytochrome)
MANLATKWSWGLGMLGTKRRFFGNIVGHATNVTDTTSLSSWTAEQFRSEVRTGKKVKKIKE